MLTVELKLVSLALLSGSIDPNWPLFSWACCVGHYNDGEDASSDFTHRVNERRSGACYGPFMTSQFALLVVSNDMKKY